MEKIMIKRFSKELQSYKVKRELKVKIFGDGVTIIKECSNDNLDVEALISNLLEGNGINCKKKVSKTTIVFLFMAALIIIHSLIIMHS